MKTRGRLCVCARGFGKLDAGLAVCSACGSLARCRRHDFHRLTVKSFVVVFVEGGRGCYLCTSGFKFLTLPRAIFKAVQMCGRECAHGCVCVCLSERAKEGGGKLATSV